MSVSIVDHTALIAFWLIFSRWLAIIMQTPIFDNVSVPTLVKILTTLIISYAFYPNIAPYVIKDIEAVGIENFWMLTIFYTLIGLLIGYLVKAIMNIFTAAGSIITQQVGFAAVRYFDPTSGQQVGPFEKIISWTILIMIISSGALGPMFKGIFGSFATVSMADMGKLAQSPIFFLNFFKSIFLASLMLASPIIFTNILIMSVLGVIARTVPQMNIIMVSFVVNIGLGLLVFISSSDEFFQVAFRMYTEKLGEWFQFVL